MKNQYLKELDKELNLHKIPDRKEIYKKYKRRYEFGLESGLTEEEIEQMLGEPIDIVKDLLNKEEEFTFTPLLDKFNLEVKTLVDDIVIIYSEDDQFHVDFYDVDTENYDFSKTEENIKLVLKKKKYFSMKRNNKGSIQIRIPENRKFKNVVLNSTTGNIELPFMDTENCSISLVNGNAKIGCISAKEASLTQVSGDFIGNKLNVDSAKISTVSGNIEFQMVIAKELKLDTISGDITFHDGKIENISSSSITGIVKINGENSGFNMKQSIKNMFKKQNKES